MNLIDPVMADLGRWLDRQDGIQAYEDDIADLLPEAEAHLNTVGEPPDEAQVRELAELWLQTKLENDRREFEYNRCQCSSEDYAV